MTSTSSFSDSLGRGFRALLWILALFGAVGGGYLVFKGIFQTRTPPREVVTVVRGMALATIPYVLARIGSEGLHLIEGET